MEQKLLRCWKVDCSVRNYDAIEKEETSGGFWGGYKMYFCGFLGSLFCFCFLCSRPCISTSLSELWDLMTSRLVTQCDIMREKVVSGIRTRDGLKTAAPSSLHNVKHDSSPRSCICLRHEVIVVHWKITFAWLGYELRTFGISTTERKLSPLKTSN